jgi:hypothetical protein
LDAIGCAKSARRRSLRRNPADRGRRVSVCCAGRIIGGDEDALR